MTASTLFPHFTHQLLECDLLVAGGGPAGVPAAIAAARAGADVILCHDRPMLGGNASSEVRMHIVGADSQRPCADLVLEPRESGIIEEIRLENAVRNPERSPSLFDLILYEKCRAEPNLRLFLNTAVTGAKVENGSITEAHAVCTSTESLFTVRAKAYLDATGDGGLGAAAGAPFIQGREDRQAYGESLAREVADGKTLGSTLLFMGKKHDAPVPFTAPPWARRFTKEDFSKRGSFLNPARQHYEYGYWWLEWGGELDTIKDNEAIRDELLAIVLGIWDYLKNSGDHGASHWSLDWFGVVPGKRESRRFRGQYVLSERDILEAPAFPDAIAYGGWPIDLHPTGGIDDKNSPPATQIPVPHLYEIPLRACLASSPDNLLFAGRNLSATHVAFASTRVMATCALVGEGVGIAAAYAIANGIAPASLPENPQLLQAIRRHLIREDLFLIGACEPDPDDLAQHATLTASSQQPAGAAANVLSTPNRSTHGERGVPPDRALPGTHRWMSDPADGLPASIELRWNEPQSLHRLEITFDSGLHRTLTLTHSAPYFQKMSWGCGPHELVKAFSIQAETASGWREIRNVAHQWQRRHSEHWATPCEVTALKITIHATWGIDHARIVRIAAY